MLEVAEDTEKLVQLIAEKTGKTPEAVIRESVEVAARHVGVACTKKRKTPAEIKKGLRALAENWSKLPVYDTRTADEILGYDEHGVPS